MKAIILNNEVKFVQENSCITITIQVPAANIEKMRHELNCTIISKKEKILHNRNYAGKVYEGTIRVMFHKIENLLRRKHFSDCTNAKDYQNLLYNKPQNWLHTEYMLLCDSVELYAFGRLNISPNGKGSNSVYTNKLGHRISLVHSELNNFGKKRYINFKGQWYSNKMY